MKIKTKQNYSKKKIKNLFFQVLIMSTKNNNHKFSMYKNFERNL